MLLKGAFDLLHIGHVNRLRAAKELGDILVVFVKCDEALRAKGPGRLVEDESQRAAVVDAVHYVDYCVIANRKSDTRYLHHHPDRQDSRCCVMIKSSIGQDSHRFDTCDVGKPLFLAGVVFEGEDALEANSDGDVVLHVVTRTITGITTVDVVGPKTKAFLEQGVTESKVYLEEALKDLDGTVVHLSVSIECKRPKIAPRIPEMRASLASLLKTGESSIGITATSGEGLTEVGRGNGIAVFAVLTADCN